MSKTSNVYTINYNLPTIADVAANLKHLVDVFVNSNERLSSYEIPVEGGISKYRIKYEPVPDYEIEFSAWVRDSTQAYLNIKIASFNPETKIEVGIADVISGTYYSAELHNYSDSISGSINVAEIDNKAICFYVNDTYTVLLTPFLNIYTNEQFFGFARMYISPPQHLYFNTYRYASYLDGKTVVIGGSSYPPGNSVASEVYVYDDSPLAFYGCVFDRHFLYKIYNESTEFKPDLWFKVALGGYTFLHIGYGYFICLDS